MLAGYDLVYFGDVWHGLKRNRHNLLQVLSRRNRVLFVERRPHLRATLRAWRAGRLTLTEVRRPAIEPIAENLAVFRYPAWAPVSGRFPLGALARLVQHQALQAALRRLGFARPIVWFYHPEWSDLVDEIPSAVLRLYHCVDEYTSYQGLGPDDQGAIEARERRLLAGVDAVLVVSPALHAAKSRHHPQTFLVPNGVNVQAYAEALADPRLPPDLERIRPPRIGYSGLIGDKLALETLLDLARARPDWSFVFLGSVNAVERLPAWQALLALPNAHYLGAVPGERVPHFLKGFEVGLMPYRQDRHSDTISPLKLYDYLAAGLPIAAVDIPAVREFRDWVAIAARPDDLPAAVEQALADGSDARRQGRRAVAARHSWEGRVEQISEIIAGLLAGSGPGR